VVQQVADGDAVEPSQLRNPLDDFCIEAQVTAFLKEDDRYRGKGLRNGAEADRSRWLEGGVIRKIG
jgi:hypothetical protein